MKRFVTNNNGQETATSKDAMVKAVAKKPLSVMVEQSSRTAVRRWVLAASGLALGTVSSLAMALGLGDISAQSYIGQPLRAKVDLINVNSDVEVNNLLVRPVGAEEAVNMGAEVYYGVHRLNVEVVERDGNVFVEVLTEESVKEPYLSLLLELRWPTGVIYREYPILLDPPPVISTPVRERNEAPKPSVAAQAKPESVASNSRITPVRELQAKPLETSDGEYKVKRGDSLSKISARWVTGTPETISNMNEWLLANNPEAFINNDMDRLIAGATLRMPDLEALRNAASEDKAPLEDTSEAPAAVAVASEELVDPEVNADAPTADVAMAEDVRGLMTVSANTDDRTRELIDMLSRENENLRSQLEKVESSEYVTTMRELVILQQKQIQDLQAKLTNGEEVPPLEPETEAMFETIGIEAPVVVGDSQGDSGSDSDLTKQELLRELNNNQDSVAVEEPNEQAIIEVEPQGVEAIVDQNGEKRSQLITILFIVGGILAALFSAMLFYYRKMVKTPVKDEAEAEELPPLNALDVEPSIGQLEDDMPLPESMPISAEEIEEAFEDLDNMILEDLEGDGELEGSADLEADSDLEEDQTQVVEQDEEDVTLVKAMSEEVLDESSDIEDSTVVSEDLSQDWLGEKASMDEVDPELEGALDDLQDEFGNLELDDEFLKDSGEELDESVLEGMTNELPSGDARKVKAASDAEEADEAEEEKTQVVEKVRRSDEELKNSIAEKMAQYDGMTGYAPNDAFMTMELDELDHLEGDEYDEVETIIYRAMMYCEFKKFDKARHLVELKKESSSDERLNEALEQIEALQQESINKKKVPVNS